MDKKIAITLMLTLLSTGIVTLTFGVQKGTSSGTIRCLRAPPAGQLARPSKYGGDRYFDWAVSEIGMEIGGISGNLHIIEPINGSTVYGVVSLTFSIHNTGDCIEFFECDSSNRIDLEIEYLFNETGGWGIVLWSTSYHGLALGPKENYTLTMLYDPSEYEEHVPFGFEGEGPYGRTMIRLVHWKQIDQGTFDYGEFGLDEVLITLTFREDLNVDGKVDLRDIAAAAQCLGSYPNHSRWNPIADMNQDSHVDMLDILQVAKHFGKTWS